MSKKRIGLLNNVFDTSIGTSKPYVEFFSNFGQVVTIDWDDEEVRNVDLLVLPGGLDVDPFRYNQKPIIQTGRPNQFFEWFDRNVLPKYIRAGIPVFGICRGMQTLNVLFGGSLKQHIYQEYSSQNRGDLVHSVELIKTKSNVDFVKSIQFNQDNFKINSLHHQAVDTVGKGFSVLYKHNKQHNVEAIIHETLPIIGVQWHPEEIYDIFSQRCVKYLLNNKFNRVNIEQYNEFMVEV